jgi:hypothetical protein
MKWIIRILALRIASILPLNILKNVVGLIVLAKYMPHIKKSQYFNRREDLWSFITKNEDNKKILFLEFGVHKGYSIQKFASYNTHSESKFIGFDSFEGLPTDWRNFIKVYKKNHFDVGGKIPQVSDSRIEFIKGWFNSTLPIFLDEFKIKDFEKVIIHLDADIYSSTLYCLGCISKVCPQVSVIFDELPGEEARALEDFLDVNGGHIKFEGYASVTRHFPMQVAVQYDKGN